MIKIFPQDKRLYQITFVVFILICMMIGCACWQYYQYLQITFKAENSGYMQEIAKQMSTNVSKTIDDNFAVLNTIAMVLKNTQMVSDEQIQAIVQEQQNLWHCQKIMLIDENGVAYDAQGKTIALSNDTYLQEAIIREKPAMSASQVIEGQECIVFVIPLPGRKIGKINVHALAASYDLSTFDRILAMNAFAGKGYAHIIGKDGTMVIGSSSQNALQTGYNILTSLSEAKIADGQRVADIRTAIAARASGQVEFTLRDTHEYMTYTPLEKQEWTLLTFVPVSVVNEKSLLLLKNTLLLCSLVTVAFSLLFASFTLNFYRNKRKLEHIAYVDPVTGGNTMQRFYELAQDLLSLSGRSQYALIYVNIEKFKVLNEQFGRPACDQVLCGIENGIASNLSAAECVGRLFADNFCVLVQYQDEATLVARFAVWHSGGISYVQKNRAEWLPLILDFGIFVIDDETIPLAQMIDRAKISLTEVAGKLCGKIRYAVYDEQVRRLLFREKKLEDMMEQALANGEFQIYLQPKYHTQTERIAGAEALVRWASPAEGMIYPDEFISLFEKNGFIIRLDFFVFEETCRTMRRWIDAGEKTIKVSVNCSRIQFKNWDFLEMYSQIAEKYAIPKHSIELELTENTVFEDVQYLSKIIREIHAVGFGCSMDDFGSGYSSLNLIQDIPVDTLKLDKIFFRTTSGDLCRTESVVSSIIAMAKALSMETVAEGVEERAQVDMLKRLQCDYVQGYYFAKPMPILEFERLAFSKVE